MLLAVWLLLPFAALAEDSAESDEYLVCQCCCPQPPEDAEVVCLYHKKGETLATVMEKDMAWHRSPASLCKARECTTPKLYRYCDGPPKMRSPQSN